MFGHHGTGKVRLLLGVMLTAVLGMLALGAAPAAAVPVGSGRPVTSIPDAAMLQPADLGGHETAPADDDLRPWLRPPQPCGVFRSAAKRTAERAIQAVYPVGDIRPTVLLEDVAYYRGTGAAQYLRELARAVGHCGGCTDQERTWRILDHGVAGRESLLLSVKETVSQEGSSRVKTTYLVAARTGHAVVVLSDIGWELGDGHEALVRQFAPAAVARASILG